MWSQILIRVTNFRCKYLLKAHALPQWVSVKALCCLEINFLNLCRISGKAKGSERAGDQFFSKLVEDFIGKARKLENDLLRYEPS